ncbi:MAG: hypothetical protein U0441_12220 [Polyangiaceae bacterium]
MGLGAFGREVAEAAFPDPAGRGRNLVFIEDADPAKVIEGAKEAIRTLLDLSHFVETTDATDARGPRCDVILVGDLGDEATCARAPALASALAIELRRELPGIFVSGEGALCVVPLLALPRAADAARVGAALAALEKASVAYGPERLGGRVYLAEDQSGKYLLSRAELTRTFAAFLNLLLLSRLRDREGGARPLVELESADPSCCFATFTCATLLFDDAALTRKCAARLATEILGVFRTGQAPSIEEIGAEAGRLALSRSALEVELWKEGSGPSRDASLLSKHLDPPKIAVPEIGEDDSPEDIVELRFGPLWRASVLHQIQAFRDDVERFKMDRLAAEIEHRGKACQERVTRELGERVDELCSGSPRGHARALEFLREALSRTKSDLDAISAAIEAPDLQDFPSSPLDAKLDALRTAVFARPRRLRMRVFGSMAAGVGAVLTAGILRGALRFLAVPDPHFFDALAPLPNELPWMLANGAIPFALGAAFSTSSTSYRLYKHRKRHHNWVVEARDDLDQAMARHVNHDIVGYFYERLDYTRLLWLKRIYRAYKERLEEALLRLEGVRAALARTEHALSQEERRLDERLDDAKSSGGILFRGVVAKSDALAVYEDVRPPEVTAVAGRLLRDSIADERKVREKDGRDVASAWAAAPFTEPARLLAFSLRELATGGGLSPFSHPSPALATAVAEAVRDMLRKLALKLSAPLTVAAVGASNEHTRRVAVVPPAARELFEKTFDAENVRGTWEINPVSEDESRVHLLVVRTDLDRASLVRAGAPRAKKAEATS